MAKEAGDLLQGTLDLLILRALAGDPMHGYGISQLIRRRTDGVLAIQDAALYQALRRLERRAWVKAEWGVTENNRRARYYALTAVGRKQLRSEVSAWRQYAEAVFRVVDLAPGEV